MKKVLTVLLTLALVLGMAACGPAAADSLEGVSISEYVIVYSGEAPDYNLRAAEYIRDQILERTGKTLQIRTDREPAAVHEILVGETARPLSKKLDADTKGLEFALLADGASVALEGDFFVIAAAAYYFVETYFAESGEQPALPREVSIHTPIQEAPKNYIFLIGDGMGPNQTKLFEYLEIPEDAETDGEDLFYGYMLPYAGWSQTKSNDQEITDSAAGGTALATGYKTNNGFIGVDPQGNRVRSLTELADSLGMATAVMSTETRTGATPAAFSAHAPSRNDTSEIIKSQAELVNTVLKSTGDSKVNSRNYKTIATVLEQLSADEDGFFIMYEEAHIDKHCHSMELEDTFMAVCRFNRAIGQFMEFAFYHPDTFVLITADHETGDLRPDDSGKLAYNSDYHSAANVPVFAYGLGAEIFHGQTLENVQIPKTIAKMWGVEDFGDPDSGYPALELAQ